jgi:serine phosphatase RsbU (regulator of sigma subunit)
MNYMKTQHLHDVWSGPDNSRLTTKQFSFRFPVHIAAKIAALSDLYPQKNRTQIVADLLTAAIDDLEKNLPQALGYPLDEESQYDERRIADHLGQEYEPLYTLGGARGKFRGLANEHYQELEKELGNDSAEPLYPSLCVTESQLKAGK